MADIVAAAAAVMMFLLDMCSVTSWLTGLEMRPGRKAKGEAKAPIKASTLTALLVRVVRRLAIATD